MAFMDFLFGEKEKTKTKPLYNPQQEKLLNSLLGAVQHQLPQGLSNLYNILGGDEQTFQAFQRPAMRNFEQEVLPTIAERFTSMLGEGSGRSSGFNQALARAGKELSEDLFSQRIGMQQDALGQLLSLLGPSLAPRYQQSVQSRRPGFLENLVVAGGEGLAKGFTQGLGGGWGTRLSGIQL